MHGIELTSELSGAFEKRGIKVVRILYHETNYLSIDVETAKDVEVYREEVLKCGQELLGEVTSYMFRHFEEAEKYEWSVFGISDFYSNEDRLVNQLIREKKEEIVELLTSSLLAEFAPDYVFSHSSNDTVESPAGYNVIFADSQLLKKSEGNGTQEKIDSLVRGLLSTDPRYIEDRFRISFSHSKSPGMYGMSRED